MRKLVSIAVAAVLLAVPAAAQDVVPIPIAQLVGSVTPPGAEASSAILRLGLTLNRESTSTARRITWTLPRNARVKPGRFRPCTRSQAGRQVCRRRSVVGEGRMVVATGDEYTPLVYEIIVYAGGARRLTFAFRAQRRRVERTAVLRGRRLVLTLPRKLQRAGGDFAYLTNFSLELGPHRTRKGPVIALRRCSKPYAYGVRIRLAPNPDKLEHPTASATARSRCAR